ncbi:Uncharacterized membrane protein [Pseudidiomarina planktonica]|uniref:Uncharacterized membrane protein n=1 Tax=Pseudidiomarina planktonica TaxID=1323738 RepID=A0A1Y6E706_9GAMM|nr:DUF502 domain-containing protein [Pseudidiomarina planktonica]RUO66372.1 DUF502 domain-containing protein [Pseudidiomarina planktonica]SMQ58476.1 Uncharacterized membrane protein [Pseudidiomarina planktonica]
MKRVLQSLVKGLAILLPIILTITLVRWLLVTMETWLKPLWLMVLPEFYYFPGLAFISFLIIAIIMGFSSRWRLFYGVWMIPGRVMEKLPVMRQLYATINDIFELMSGKNFTEESVVLVTLPGSHMQLIGIVTKKSGVKGDMISECLDEDQIAVYLPMSYMVGGYMVMVPRNCTTNLDMSPSDAMQLVISGGLGKGQRTEPAESDTKNKSKE